MSIPKIPYIKGKNFCPNPIVRYGIPRECDSSLNLNVIGTAAYEEFWQEQVHRCIHGYDTGGIFIPGRYYYFLNFKKFKVVGKGIVNADICDLHLELAYWIEDCKQRRRNGIIAKKRRGGISEAFITMVVDYGFRFLNGYSAGVAAGLGTYKDEFMKKWEEHNNLIVPEFSKKIVVGEDDEIIASYKKDTPVGWKTLGSQNTIYNKTMFQTPNLFKGLALNDICAEEGIEFKNLGEFFAASEACLRFGSAQLGSFFTWGTGGNRKSNGEDFEDMWHNPDTFKMEKLFIDGPRFHHPFYGGASEYGKIINKLPNFSQYKDYQLIGVEDMAAAKINILEEREIKRKAGDVKKYIEECQNNPLTVDEVFKRASSNKFSIDVLNDVGFDVASKPIQYVKYKLDYEKNKEGERIIPLKIIATAAKDTDLEKDCVLISIDGHPRDLDNLYCAGIDSYDQDQSKVTKSLGAMCVITRNHSLASLPTMKPVCVIRCRPDRKEKFYEMCLMVSIYYNLVGSTLVDHAKPGIIEHYKKNNGTKFLARRPAKLESANSEQGHDYGVSLNKYSRPIMVSYMQSAVLDHGHKIVFADLIDELKAYDEYTNDSDNDLADAYGIAIVQNYSSNLKPRDESQKDRNKKYLLNDEDYGRPVLKNIEQDHDNFGK